MVVVVAMRGGAHSAKRAHARLSASLARAQKKEEKKEKKKGSQMQLRRLGTTQHKRMTRRSQECTIVCACCRRKLLRREEEVVHAWCGSGCMLGLRVCGVCVCVNRVLCVWSRRWK
jgi:hypothetical protein